MHRRLMTEEQIYHMRYVQWVVYGERYDLKTDLFLYPGQFGVEGFPRYILFRNGYDRDDPDAIPITVDNHPVVLSDKRCRISDEDFSTLCSWIASHRTEINALMDGRISQRQFIDQTSNGPSVKVEIEDGLLLPMRQVTSMRMLEPDYILFLLEYFCMFDKSATCFNVDVFVADQDICEFGEIPLVVLVGNGYGEIADYQWDCIAVTVAEHPVVVSATEIRIAREDLDEVCQWVSANRHAIKALSVSADHRPVSQSLKGWRKGKEKQ